MKIILLGPPGAGKGTQGARLEREFGFRRISIGDMLRDHETRGTALGRKSKVYSDRGELTPDEIVLGIIKEELDSENIIFDGFPRNIFQAEAFERILSERGETLKAAVLIDVPDEEVMIRLTMRRMCRDCGAIYNLITHAPKKDEICDACGGTLYQRDDDTVETVVHRLMVYQKVTEPIIEFYRKKGKLVVIGGMGNPDEIYAELKGVLGL